MFASNAVKKSFETARDKGNTDLMKGLQGPALFDRKVSLPNAHFDISGLVALNF